jgi:hypothetical protein
MSFSHLMVDIYLEGAQIYLMSRLQSDFKTELQEDYQGQVEGLLGSDGKDKIAFGITIAMGVISILVDSWDMASGFM